MSAHLRFLCTFLFVAYLFQTTALAQPGFTLGSNFTGSSLFAQSGSVPPDTMGAIGPNHFVELINGRYRAYNRTGVEQQTSTLLSFFQTATGDNTLNDVFDPRINFDKATGLWYAVAAAQRRSSGSSFVVAVSNTSNPTGGWTGRRVDADAGNTLWLDFPTVGYNGQSYVVSANMFAISNDAYSTTRNWILPKNNIIAGTPTIFNQGTGTIQPAVDLNATQGGSPANVDLPMLSRFNNTSLARHTVTGSVASPSVTFNAAIIATSSAPSPVSAPQLGSSTLIQTNDNRISGNMIRINGELWGVTNTTRNTRSALYWFRINEVTNSVINQGFIEDPSRSFYFGSLGVNSQGAVVIGYSGSSPNDFVGTFASIGLASGSSVNFTSPQLIQAGLASYSQGNPSRWGDYSAVTVDPTNENSFWIIQEYASATNTWSTRITEIIVAVPEPATLALGAVVVLGAGWFSYRKHRRTKKAWNASLSGKAR